MISKTSLVLLVMFAVAPSTSTNHPYHVSLCEIELNPKTGNLEVALCVWPADLEKAISRSIGKPIDLDQADDLDQKIAEYVSRRFTVKAAGGSDAWKIRWVGHEHNLKHAWLYFELIGEQPSGDWLFSNRVFFELNDEQLNQINFKADGKTQHFSLNQSRPETRISAGRE